MSLFLNQMVYLRVSLPMFLKGVSGGAFSELSIDSLSFRTASYQRFGD